MFNREEIIRTSRLAKPERTVSSDSWLSHCLSEMNNDGFYPFASYCELPQLGSYITSQFGEISSGTFVEVGANDGHRSNSCGLADIGWRGVYIEPIPDLAQKCTIRHSQNKVDIWNCACGGNFGQIKLYIAPNNGESSTAVITIKDYYEKNTFKDQDFTKSIEVPQMPLDVILSESKIEANFELLIVDVEGMEPEVFAGFGLDSYRPQMIVVELWDFTNVFPNPFREPHIQTRNHILSHGYETLEMIGYNTIFVRS